MYSTNHFVGDRMRILHHRAGTVRERMGSDRHNQNNPPDPSTSHNALFTMPIDKGKQERLEIIGLRAKGFSYSKISEEAFF